MTGLADVDGFKIFIQVCVWLGLSPPITVSNKKIVFEIKIAQSQLQMSLVVRSFSIKIRQKHPKSILDISLKLFYLINLLTYDRSKGSIHNRS